MVQREIELPKGLAAKAGRYGFEGVAVLGEGGDERVVVAIQRPWKDAPDNQTMLAIYTPATETWTFVGYHLDAPAGEGWVGLSEVTALGGEKLALIERDNQGGPSAMVKKVTVVDLTGITPVSAGAPLPELAKTEAVDVLPFLQALHGWTIEKIEGLAYTDGRLGSVSDNDGVADAVGESRFIDLGPFAATN